MSDTSYPLTVFYDGACPVCSAEMLQLQSEDRHHRIVLDDVSGEAGRVGRVGVSQQALLDCIHALTADGRLLKGVDVFEQVYRAVGRDRAASAVGWPLMRWLAERSYPLFVRHRHSERNPLNPFILP
jgi:predicted DCC family thiol-disulfide oxidoreductase YuxK